MLTTWRILNTKMKKSNPFTTIRYVLPACLSAFVLVAVAQTEFTALEQQKINIETPGLFASSDVFTVEFGSMPSANYSFPLPVGTATVKSDLSMEITTKKGDAVKAMFPGTVRMSWLHPRYGHVVVLRHDNGLETVYARNAQNLVKVGDHVRAGQTIAIVGGEDGRVFCDFSVMVNGGRINPEIMISPKSHRLLSQTVEFRKRGFNVEVTVVDPDPWSDKNLAKKNTDRGIEATDPFAGGSKFTLYLDNISDEDWCYPLLGAKVISPFGQRGGRRHTGVDLKTRPNDPILAAFDGVVVMSQRYSGYGNCVILKHANGLQTLYSHNSKNLVKVGDRVRAGQKLALTGRTGRATTEHLHFEVRINGRPYNPNIIFDHATRQLRREPVTFTKSGGVSAGKRLSGKKKISPKKKKR